MGKGRVLLVATWGYPPAWYEYEYVISIEHRAFHEISGFRCRSCSSTLAIATALMSKGWSVDMLIFGLDTVVDPSSVRDGNLRERAEELYGKWFNELVDQCDKCRDLDLANKCSTDIVILPGKGRFYGWEFRGSVAHLFNKAFLNMLKKLRSGYSFVVLDITHGINFQLVTVLYAAVAAIVLKNLEDRFLMLNSEPVTGGDKKCIKVQSPRTITRELGVIDVSKLQQAIAFIRALAHLRNLSTKPVERLIIEMLREIRRERAELTEAVKLLMKRLVPFFKLLENGAYGPTYINAFVEDSEGERPLGVNPCIELRSPIALSRFDYKPIINATENVVDYEHTSISHALKVAIDEFLVDICRRLESNDLIEYLEKVGRYHESEGHLYGYLIAFETGRSLRTVISYVIKCSEKLPKEYIELKDSNLVIDVLLYRALSENLRGVWKALYEGACFEFSEDALRSVKDMQMTDVEKLRNAKEINIKDEKFLRFVRNMMAHGGLEYATLKKLVVTKSGDTEGRITKIIYDGEILNKILKAMNIELSKHTDF